MLGKSRPTRSSQSKRRDKKQEEALPTIDDFLSRRDYEGSLALVDFLRASKQMQAQDALEWKAYCHFHNGEHDKALECYENLLKDPNPDPMFHLYAGCCHFYMGDYEDALQCAKRGPRCQLQTRLLLHVANKMGDDDLLMSQHAQLHDDDLHDALSLAALYYVQGSFEKAADIFKKLLADHTDLMALNVYVAMCYSKMEYWDISNEILGVYLSAFPDSILGINLKACNAMLRGSGKEGETELRTIEKLGGNIDDHALTRHNLVVMRNGEDALRVLPGLVDSLHEARVNLCNHHVKAGAVEEAFELVRDLEPSQAQEFILKGVVHTLMGQASGSEEHLRLASNYFQTIGSAKSDCDTIPGRQAMASAYFLNRAFEDVNIYLDSIAKFVPETDVDFNWNYGISRAAVGEFHEGLRLLERVMDPKARADFVYMAWLSRCYVMTGNPKAAWELYHQMESTQEAYQLLLQIANDCYRMGHFLHAAKAFDVLERLDPSPEFWSGKRGACVGVVQMVLAGKEAQESVREVCQLLASPTTQEAEQLYDVISNWAEMNGIAEISM